MGARPGGPHSGPRPGGRPGAPSAGGPGGFRRGGRPPIRRKVCRFCAEKIREIDYKAVPLLRPFLTARGKLLSGRITGNCAKCQRNLTQAIKRAQTLSLLPYTGD
jgi:small subunit ribosomal protein S18